MRWSVTPHTYFQYCKPSFSSAVHNIIIYYPTTVCGRAVKTATSAKLLYVIHNTVEYRKHNVNVHRRQWYRCPRIYGRRRWRKIRLMHVYTRTHIIYLLLFISLPFKSFSATIRICVCVTILIIVVSRFLYRKKTKKINKQRATIIIIYYFISIQF